MDFVWINLTTSTVKNIYLKINSHVLIDTIFCRMSLDK